ncbi:MAG: FtsL-like putative cell division protein [Cytophagaceae bacterium]|jgi:cell division protein FtsL|nr:FtsL-like putative cell division protein [Cytophagaceae bacterium]
MAENSYRRKTEQYPDEENEEQEHFEKSQTIFEVVESKLGLNKILTKGLPLTQLPKVLFLLLLVLLYVANTHYGDKLVRRTNKLKNEVEDLRADYITLKAELMFKSKQSEVAKRVAALELEEPVTPPYKIVVEEEDLTLETPR